MKISQEMVDAAGRPDPNRIPYVFGGGW